MLIRFLKGLFLKRDQHPEGQSAPEPKDIPISHDVPAEGAVLKKPEPLPLATPQDSGCSLKDTADVSGQTAGAESVSDFAGQKVIDPDSDVDGSPEAQENKIMELEQAIENRSESGRDASDENISFQQADAAEVSPETRTDSAADKTIAAHSELSSGQTEGEQPNLGPGDAGPQSSPGNSIHKGAQSGMKQDAEQSSPESPAQCPRVLFVGCAKNLMNKQCLGFLDDLKVQVVSLKERGMYNRPLAEDFVLDEDIVFAVVLLAGDEFVYAKDEKPSQARMQATQRHVLELGYCLAKFGKFRTFVLYFEKPNFNLPTGYGDAIYVPFNLSGEWRGLLKNRLLGCGIIQKTSPREGVDGK